MFRKSFGIDRFSEVVRTDWDMDSDIGIKPSISLLPGEILSEEELNRHPTSYRMIIRTSHEKQLAKGELSENDLTLSSSSDESESQVHVNEFYKNENRLNESQTKEPKKEEKKQPEKHNSDDKGHSKKTDKIDLKPANKLHVKVRGKIEKKKLHRFIFRLPNNRIFILFQTFREHLNKKQAPKKKST